VATRGTAISEIGTLTNSGLHEFVVQNVLTRYARRGIRAADLGTGPGAIANELQVLGCDVIGVDVSAQGFKANLPHVIVNFDQPDFASILGNNAFGLITCVEVIEHVENPIGFLRNIGNMLVPGGIAVLTTPNVESLPARLKLLLFGRVRTMDEHGDPTHISPIYIDLLKRQFLKRTRLELKEHLVFPPRGFQLSRKPTAALLGLVARILPGEHLLGDNHVCVFTAKA
jgi:2-polyprenyl-3-methyl-5-hydroxy-6-metoxy-1,4-benzoquinol methylase